MTKVYNDVLVLSRSGNDMYLGRASGSPRLGYTGKWINLDGKNKVMEARFYGGEFLIVDDLEVNLMMQASRVLMGIIDL